MAYKTILAHLDESPRAAERIRIAADLALLEDAHLIGAAMTGVSRHVYKNDVVDTRDPHLALHLDVLREQAKRALPAFETTVEQMGVTSFETRVVDDEAGDGLSLAARYSDLVVIGQTDPDVPLRDARPNLPAYVVMHAARPVLIVPYAGRFDRVGHHVLIAWDGSIQATRAVRNAMPFLERANIVSVAVINSPPITHVHGEEPGADLALYLAHRGIHVHVLPLTAGHRGVGATLLSTAADLPCDLIVMGSYGHTRVQEIILGSVTRAVLDTMTMPVLMSH